MTPQARNPWRPLAAGLALVALCVAAIWLARGTSGSADAAAEAEPAPEPVAPDPVETGHLPAPAPPPVTPVAFTMPDCPAPSAGTAPKAERGNPEARRAAQRGLGYLAGAATAWQEQHGCYGCHVQAVTLQAFSVGVHHQYEVNPKALATIKRGMLELPGGARHATGLGYQHGSEGEMIYDAGKIFGAASFARYDQLVARDVGKELLAEAEKIRKRQTTAGEVPMSYANPPVSIGSLQGTAEAIIAWRQAYERTADDQWLTAISRAEAWLRAQIEQQRTGSLQELAWLIMGLRAAGVGAEQSTMIELRRKLLAMQDTTGGFPRQPGGVAEPFATGQALYALRLLGMTDHDRPVARGTSWLMEKQQPDGGWSAAGFGKAEAMWAVLGLVSTDVITASVTGIADGERVTGIVKVGVAARDNQGGGVTKVEIAVDDLPAAGSCGGELSWSWDTRALTTGMHVVDVRATNHKGEVSRRRLEVFAGDVWMTQLGSRYADGGTEVSLRDLAEPGRDHRVSLEIWSTEGSPRKVATIEQPGAAGALRFFWDGRDTKGAVQTNGRYTAKLAWTDAGGAIRQRAELPFVHDTPAAQAARYGQIEGALALPEGAAAANAVVELVDEAGNVVQRTNSTREGEWRFKNVDGDRKYRVRVVKDGFEAEDPAPAALVPAAGGSVRQDVKLKKK